MEKAAKDEVLEEIEGGSSLDEIVTKAPKKEGALYKGAVKYTEASAFLKKFEASYGAKLKMSTISVRMLQKDFEKDILSA